MLACIEGNLIVIVYLEFGISVTVLCNELFDSRVASSEFDGLGHCLARRLDRQGLDLLEFNWLLALGVGVQLAYHGASSRFDEVPHLHLLRQTKRRLVVLPHHRALVQKKAVAARGHDVALIARVVAHACSTLAL